MGSAFHLETRGRLRTPRPEQTRYQGEHEPLIAEANWHQAQAIRQSRFVQQAGRGNGALTTCRYVLSGILRCTCGAKMRVASAHRRARKSIYKRKTSVLELRRGTMVAGLLGITGWLGGERSYRHKIGVIDTKA